MPLDLVVIVPFLNEAAVLDELLTSLAAQVRRPDLALLVDDGSTDGSDRIVAAHAERHPWMRLLQRPPRDPGRDRLATASEFVAFQWALEQVDRDWDVVAKMDADLRLPPRMLQELEQHLLDDPSLGIVGTYLRERPRTGGEDLVRLVIPEEHVHGATKFYRRACWEAIAPQPAILGWDSIDERTARQRGWTTRSVALSEGDPVHLRPRGSYDGDLRAYRRWGRCDWATGEPPVLVAALSLRHMRSEPKVVGGLHYAAGYVTAALQRAPRAAAPVRAQTRREEWAKVARLVRRRPDRVR